MTGQADKLVLFLSNDAALGRTAQTIFQDEGNKAEVAWTAIARLFAAVSEPVDSDDCEKAATIDDLRSAALVVVLKRSSSEPGDLKSIFPAWSGETEVWNINTENETQALNQNIGKLLVFMILKGGKRPALAKPSSETAQPNVDASKSAVRVRLESKGRKGKKVTTVSGLLLDDNSLQKLGTELKQLCGSGGTVKDGQIEIQGDQCDRILAELQKRGYKAKRAGG